MFRSTLLTHCARWFDQVAKKRNDYGPLHGLTHVLIRGLSKECKNVRTAVHTTSVWFNHRRIRYVELSGGGGSGCPHFMGRLTNLL